MARKTGNKRKVLTVKHCQRVLRYGCVETATRAIWAPLPMHKAYPEHCRRYALETDQVQLRYRPVG